MRSLLSAVLVGGFLVGCAHAPRVSTSGMWSRIAKVTELEPGGAGGRVQFMGGTHGRRKATELMRDICNGPARVTAEHELWVAGWGWSGDGAVVMTLPSSHDTRSSTSDVELAFACRPPPVSS
jgi:hypothetical protein